MLSLSLAEWGLLLGHLDLASALSVFSACRALRAKQGKLASVWAHSLEFELAPCRVATLEPYLPACRRLVVWAPHARHPGYSSKASGGGGYEEEEEHQEPPHWVRHEGAQFFSVRDSCARFDAVPLLVRVTRAAPQLSFLCVSGVAFDPRNRYVQINWGHRWHLRRVGAAGKRAWETCDGAGAAEVASRITHELQETLRHVPDLALHKCSSIEWVHNWVTQGEPRRLSLLDSYVEKELVCAWQRYKPLRLDIYSIALSLLDDLPFVICQPELLLEEFRRTRCLLQVLTEADVPIRGRAICWSGGGPHRNYSALECALEHLPLLHYLVNERAMSPDLKIYDEPLAFSALTRPSALENLLRVGASPFAWDRWHNTVVHAACRQRTLCNTEEELESNTQCIAMLLSRLDEADMRFLEEVAVRPVVSRRSRHNPADEQAISAHRQTPLMYFASKEHWHVRFQSAVLPLCASRPFNEAERAVLQRFHELGANFSATFAWPLRRAGATLLHLQQFEEDIALFTALA